MSDHLIKQLTGATCYIDGDDCLGGNVINDAIAILRAQAARIAELEKRALPAAPEFCSTWIADVDGFQPFDLSHFRANVQQEAAYKAHKLLVGYAAEKGSTKTPQGRTALFYARKVKSALIEKDPQA